LLQSDRLGVQDRKVAEMESDQTVLAHHQAAATMWGRGGRHYDDVSFAISDALAHACQRLNARAGECILDVATGTGWCARSVARMGATVTAVDISQELLAAARELSVHVRPTIDFRHADAERLPFGDNAFDGVISTFGIMFALDQTQAAAELKSQIEGVAEQFLHVRWVAPIQG